MKKLKNPNAVKNRPPLPQAQPVKAKQVPAAAASGSMTLAAAVLCFLVGFLIYSNSFKDGYHLDDELSIVNNPTIKTLSHLDQLWYFYKARFLTYYSFALNFHLGGLEPYGFHLFNILIHIACGLALFWLTVVTFRTPELRSHPLAARREWAGVLAALLFLAHPVQTQAVTYIVQRAASLATLFYLGTLIFYAKARLESKPWYYLAALASGLGSVFSKEIGYTLPFCVLLYEFAFFGFARDWPKRAAVASLFFIPVIVVYFAVYHGAVIANPKETSLESIAAGAEFSRKDYLLTQFNVIRTYIRLLFFPVELNLDYDYPISRHFFEPRTVLSFAFLAGVAALGVKLWKKDRLVAFGIFAFFVTISLESSIFVIRDVIFEHRLYLPLFGFSLAMVSGLYHFFKNWRDFLIAGLVVTAVLGGLTFKRNTVWRTEITLWQDVLKKAPRKPRAYINLGNAYLDRGNFRKAEELYRQCLEVDPKHAEAFNALGALYHHKNDFDKAIEHYKKALEIEPGYIDAIYNLGLSYSKKEDYDKAIAQFQEAIRLRPFDADPYNDMGIAYGLKKEYPAAIDAFVRGLKVSPNSPKLHENLAVAYIKQGEKEKAMKQIGELRRLGQYQTASELESGLEDKDESARGGERVMTQVYFEKGKVIRTKVVTNPPAAA